MAAVSVVSVSAQATLSCPFADGNGANTGACIAGQGSWQTSLQARDFGNDGTIDAYYDPDLDLTWLADANHAQTSGFDADGRMTFSVANGWAFSLNSSRYLGGTAWRLPTVTPVNDTATFNISFSNNGSTDDGYAETGIGWGAASEMGYMYCVHLGNRACARRTMRAPVPVRRRRVLVCRTPVRSRICCPTVTGPTNRSGRRFGTSISATATRTAAAQASSPGRGGCIPAT